MIILPNGEAINLFHEEKDYINISKSLISIACINNFGYRNLHGALATIPQHLHYDSYEFIYILKGCLQFTCGSCEYSLKSGDVFIVKPGELHGVSGSPTNIFEGYIFQLTSNPNLYEKDEKWSRVFFTRLDDSRNSVITVGTSFRSAMETTLSYVTSNNSYQKERAINSVFYFVYSLLEAQITPHPSSLSTKISHAIEYINEHLQENPQLSNIANECGMSLSSFKHKFSEEIGISPLKYINTQRIEAAKKMLENGWSVTDTSYELEFTSSSQFSLVFKRMTSITPTEYRNKHYTDKKRRI